MKFYVHAKLNKKKRGVEKTETGSLVVWTTAPAIDNRANEDIIEQLAEHFGVSKSQVNLVVGPKSKLKVFEIKK